eukprot:TRINITY_DN3573_c0_g1_i1.p1 TRINITY_DN3573_c0_g1~~TRINITY_DN3573_c0_g1_i1.p1  ORF type:complete len:457 (-),score=121.27 TRINITY_DN3573_c0_g1_i1:46-1416(-)
MSKKELEVKEVPSGLFGSEDSDDFFSSPPPTFAPYSSPYSSFSPVPTFSPFSSTITPPSSTSFSSSAPTQPAPTFVATDYQSPSANTNSGSSFFDSFSSSTPVDDGSSFFESLSSGVSDPVSPNLFSPTPPSLFVPSHSDLPPTSSPPPPSQFPSGPKASQYSIPTPVTLFPPSSDSSSDFFLSLGSSPPRVKSSPDFLALAAQAPQPHLETASVGSILSSPFSPESTSLSSLDASQSQRGGIVAQHSRSRSFSGPNFPPMKTNIDRHHGFAAFAFGHLILVSSTGQVRVTTLRQLYTRAKEQNSRTSSSFLSSSPPSSPSLSLSPFSLSSNTDSENLSGFSYFQSLLKFPGPLTKTCKPSEDKPSITDWSSWSLSSSLAAPPLTSLAPTSLSVSTPILSGASSSPRTQLKKYIQEHFESLQETSSASTSVHTDAVLSLFSLLREKIQNPTKCIAH